MEALAIPEPSSHLLQPPPCPLSYEAPGNCSCSSSCILVGLFCLLSLQLRLRPLPLPPLPLPCHTALGGWAGSLSLAASDQCMGLFLQLMDAFHLLRPPGMMSSPSSTRLSIFCISNEFIALYVMHIICQSL